MNNINYATKGEHKVIAVCISAVAEQTQAQMVQDITKNAKNMGYRVVVYATFSDLYNDDNSNNSEQKIFNLIDYDMFDGLVIWPETIKNDSVIDTIASQCVAHNLPFVSIDRELEGAYNVLFDYTSAFEELVRHVVEVHGCRRINLISGIEGNSFSMEREAVFRKVLEENDIPVEEERIGYGCFWDQPTIKVMEEFLSSDLEMPEAIVCCNDTMAMAACKVLENHGYNIPSDILVTGFDGIDMEQYHSPRLTTARMDICGAAKKAIETIHALNQGQRVKKVQRIAFDVTPSQSCGCVSMHAQGQLKKVMDVYNMMSYRNDFDEYINRMSMKVADAESIKEAIPIIKEYCFEAAALCVREDLLQVNPSEESTQKDFPENSKILLHRLWHEWDMNTFPSKSIIPDLWEVLDTLNMVMVAPVHFLDKVIGYYMIPVEGASHFFVNIEHFIREIGKCIYIVSNKERMNFLLTRDPMTAIYNRRGFYKHIRKLIEEAKKVEGDQEIIIHSMDLDGLKTINDTYGHSAGDNAITVAAKKLIQAAKHDEICARFGGDEYVVFAVAPKDEAERFSKEFVEDYLGLLEEYNQSAGLPYQVKSSIGSSHVSIASNLGLDQIISMADQLMYSDKAKHKREHKR